MMGREKDFEELNRQALRLAREVAMKYGVMAAGAINNTLLYKPGDQAAHFRIRAIFKVCVILEVCEQ